MKEKRKGDRGQWKDEKKGGGNIGESVNIKK